MYPQRLFFHKCERDFSGAYHAWWSNEPCPLLQGCIPREGGPVLVDESSLETRIHTQTLATC
jgi:hypothetical protein